MATLYVVATPIGNLGDLTPRASQILSEADLIGCEDTRRTGTLMQHIGSRAGRFIVVNEHTELDAAAEIVDALNQGHRVAIVSDAGTPAISDPGSIVVRAALTAGHEVVAVPGPSAVVAALSISGMDSRRFIFEGFLPRDGKERSERIAAVKQHQYTTVLYEAPHRLLRTITDLHKALGDTRSVVVIRELTKLHEESWRGSMAAARAHFESLEPIGEYVILVDAAPPIPEATDQMIDNALLNALAEGDSVKEAANEVAEMFALPKRNLYERALRLRGNKP